MTHTFFLPRAKTDEEEKDRIFAILAWKPPECSLRSWDTAGLECASAPPHLSGGQFFLLLYSQIHSKDACVVVVLSTVTDTYADFTCWYKCVNQKCIGSYHKRFFVSFDSNSNNKNNVCKQSPLPPATEAARNSNTRLVFFLGIHF